MLRLSPQPQENRYSPGILTPESCYTASSFAAKGDMVTCPSHSCRQSLHQIWLCLRSPNFYFMLVKNTGLITLASPYPHARVTKSLLHLVQPMHVHWDVLGPAGGPEGQFGFHGSLPHWPLRQKCKEKTGKWQRSGRQAHTC